MSNQPNQHQEESSSVYLCPNCGGNMEFDIESQMLKCPYCENQIDIKGDKSQVKEYDFNDVLHKETSGEWDKEVSVVKCDSCGAETVVERHQTALHCSYCGSSHVLESKQSAGIKPEGIVPFQVDKHKAKGIFDKWIRRRWFAPNKLKQLYQSDKMLSVYIPYWTYDAQTYNDYTAEGGEVYYVTVERNGKEERERRVRWHRVRGSFDMFFDDVQVHASKNYDASLMKRIEPYDTKQVEPYKPHYISGYLAERYSLGVVECFEDAKNQMHNELVEEVRRSVRRRYDEVRNIHINTQYSDVKYKHVLLPLWTAQYDYNGKKYRYMINGQNGRISGKSPVSAVKVTILVALILGIIGTIIYLNRDTIFATSQINLLNELIEMI